MLIMKVITLIALNRTLAKYKHAHQIEGNSCGCKVTKTPNVVAVNPAKNRRNEFLSAINSRAIGCESLKMYGLPLKIFHDNYKLLKFNSFRGITST